MTLSAADATAHIIENPLRPRGAARAPACAITLVLIALLGAVFLRGFTEAIGIAVALVGVVPAAQRRRHRRRARGTIAKPPAAWSATGRAPLTTQHGNPLVMVALALLVFPKLALGLSGFETGVAVMPLGPGRRAATPRSARSAASAAPSKLLTDGRPDHERLPGREQLRHDAADPGRRVRRTAGRRTGGRSPSWRTSTSATASARSTTSSTIAILWFAGASAMAGLLNLDPALPPSLRHGPGVGRAPSGRWCSCFTAVGVR